MVPRTVDEAIAASGPLGFPLLVKPAQSHLYYRAFGRKMARVRDRAELELCYKEATSAGLEVIVQEVIPGHDDEVVELQRLLPGRRGPGGVHGATARKAPRDSAPPGR